MRTSEQLNELATALAKAQAKFKNAVKDKQNPFFKSSYADLESVVDAARPGLAEFGLSFMQLTRIAEQETVLVTRVLHSSGQWIEGEYPVIVAKNDPQGFGSGLTYARRYSLAAALGVVTGDDDDAEAAMNRPNPKFQQTVAPKKIEAKKEVDKKVEPKKAPKGGNEAPISVEQQKAIFLMAETKNMKPTELAKKMQDQFGVQKSGELKMWQYESLFEEIRGMQ